MASLLTGGRSGPPARLATKSELRDDRAVPLDVFAPEVLQQPASSANEHQQAAAAVVILLVELQVLGEVADAPGQHRDLHLGGAGIARRPSMLLDDLGLGFLGQRHGRTPRLPAGTDRRPRVTLSRAPHR